MAATLTKACVDGALLGATGDAPAVPDPVEEPLDLILVKLEKRAEA
jgi:hypothetical protein